MAKLHQLWPLVTVQDINRSLGFYRDQLGFTVARHADDATGNLFWCRLERGGVSLMLQQATDEDATDRGRGITFYFLCDDANAVHAEFASRGLPLQSPTVAYYGMNQLYLADPDNYQLCFENDIT